MTYNLADTPIGGPSTFAGKAGYNAMKVWLAMLRFAR